MLTAIDLHEARGLPRPKLSSTLKIKAEALGCCQQKGHLQRSQDIDSVGSSAAISMHRRLGLEQDSKKATLLCRIDPSSPAPGTDATCKADLSRRHSRTLRDFRSLGLRKSPSIKHRARGLPADTETPSPPDTPECCHSTSKGFYDDPSTGKYSEDKTKETHHPNQFTLDHSSQYITQNTVHAKYITLTYTSTFRPMTERSHTESKSESRILHT